MSVPDWRQPQGLRGRPGFKPTCRAEFAAWTASGRAGLDAGGRRQGQGGLSGRAKLRPVGGCRGACRAGLGAGGRRQGLGWIRDDAPSHTSATMHHWFGGHRWAAAGPGRASRRRTKRTISNQAPAVWRPPRGLRGLAAVPVGGGRTRAGSETTHRATRQRPCTTGLEGAGGSGGPGRASRSTTPSEARVWRSRGRPGPTAPGKPVVPQAPPESQNSS